MSERWIVPCNLKFFNIEEHLSHTNIIVWKNSFTIKQNDIVYIYIAAPISAIMYRCRVIDDTVSEKVLEQNQYAISRIESHNYFSKKTKYIILQKDREYSRNLLNLATLRLHGLGQVQIQARADRLLSQYLASIDDDLDRQILNGCD